MADDALPAALLLAVLRKVEADDCARAACVDRRWRYLASDDAIWAPHCLHDFSVYSPKDPFGKSCRSFKAAYEVWRREFGDYKGFVSRTKKCWDDLIVFLKAKYPEVAETMRAGASEEQLEHVEASLGITLPAPVRMIYRICDGQEVVNEQSSHLYVGLLGGYYFYHHFVNVQMLPLKQVVKLTQRLIPQLHLPSNSQKIVIAASCNLNKFFFVDCVDGMVYVGTKYLLATGEMIPCVPPSPPSDKVESKDGMLKWLEEYRNRLLNGMFKIRNDEGMYSISLFPEKEPLCTKALTFVVEVKCSAVFVPELSSPTDVLDKYLFCYCVRMRMVSSECGASFNQCQLSRRHWVIKSDGVVVDEVRGEAVVGMFPILKDGGDVFVYESCSHQSSPTGSIEGDFTFVPGSLVRAEGREFTVRVAAFPLEVPHYIF